MVTNKVVKTTDSDAIYAAFLNKKGRMLADSILYHRPGLMSYFVEVSPEAFQPIIAHLHKFKLRKTIFIDEEVPKTHAVWSILAKDLEWRDRLLRNLLNQGDLGSAMSIYVDPRWELSIRVILPQGEEPPLKNLDLEWEEEGSQQLYDYLRWVHGLPEGQKEMPSEKQIPLEANMDHFSGINFQKGCYLGQELIARTHFRGELRKSIFALRSLHPYSPNYKQFIKAESGILIPEGLLDGLADIDDGGENLVDQNVLWEKEGKLHKTGTVLDGKNNIVLSMVRFEHLVENNFFRVGENSDLRWQVILPHWAQHKE
eukprot:TRINITY_DN7103_c0_g1_i1.p1 TRINITY_DN7103_c0_g1~~TRINITY_DN7103_c0_g1_i1.p1  ORF type:complete len:365 (+),score=77.23 TRINITY_DN7103_c0_g1_i1:156-1097(+)